MMESRIKSLAENNIKLTENLKKGIKEVQGILKEDEAKQNKLLTKKRGTNE